MIGFASAAVFARFAPTVVVAEDISNATVGSDQALGEKGKKVAIFGAALVAADVIAGLVFGKSMLGIASGKEDASNWKTRLADTLLLGRAATLPEALVKMQEALGRGDDAGALRLLEDAEARFAGPEVAAAAAEKDLEALGTLRRKVLFAAWKAGAAARAPLRTEADKARLAELKRSRREEARRLLKEENAEQDERISRGRSKEEGDQGYMEAEELLRAGRLEEARQALALAERNWARAGMMNLGGRPFESAIDGLRSQIDAAAAAAAEAQAQA